MLFPRVVCGLAVASVALWAGPASADVIFATDFNSAALGAYDTLGTHTVADSVINAGGIGTDDLTVRVGSGSAVNVVDRGGGNRALQFTDNTTITDTTLPRAYSNSFTMSTNGTGNNRLVGSFDYTRLLSTTGNALPQFYFLASANGIVSLSPTDNAIRVSVGTNGNVIYTIGGAAPANVDSGVTLTAGTEYHFEINGDFSSGSQDTWGLKVTPVGSTTPVLNLTGLATRGANVQVNMISMLGGANQTAVNASPFAQVDNISFSAVPVPEPASIGLAAAAGGLLMLRRKRQWAA